MLHLLVEEDVSDDTTTSGTFIHGLLNNGRCLTLEIERMYLMILLVQRFLATLRRFG